MRFIKIGVLLLIDLVLLIFFILFCYLAWISFFGEKTSLEEVIFIIIGAWFSGSVCIILTFHLIFIRNHFNEEEVLCISE